MTGLGGLVEQPLLDFLAPPKPREGACAVLGSSDDFLLGIFLWLNHSGFNKCSLAPILCGALIRSGAVPAEEGVPLPRDTTRGGHKRLGAGRFRVDGSTEINIVELPQIVI